VRCAFCGRAGEPGRDLAAGPGVAICGGCAAAATAVVGAPAESPAPVARPGWGRGGVDPAALAAVSQGDLIAEATLVWEIAAPLQAYLEAAKAALGVADDDRPRCAGHRDPVTLADGSVVWAVSFAGADPYARDERPDYGLYLDERWSPPWPHDHVHWPDFDVPADRAAAEAALAGLLARARAGERVEIGCLGGHGRTGTALALLAVLAGTPAPEAVAWVRSAYCPRAVETAEQEAFVTG